MRQGTPSIQHGTGDTQHKAWDRGHPACSMGQGTPSIQHGIGDTQHTAWGMGQGTPTIFSSYTYTSETALDSNGETLNTKLIIIFEINERILANFDKTHNKMIF